MFYRAIMRHGAIDVAGSEVFQVMLKALVDYYEYLRSHNKEGIVAPGWSPTKVIAFLDLDQEGNLVNVIPVEENAE